MKQILLPLWFLLRYLVVIVLFVAVTGLGVSLYEPTPLLTMHGLRTWSPILLLEDRIFLSGSDDATPEGHATIRTLSLDGVELSRFHLERGEGTFKPHPSATLVAILMKEGYRLLQWDLNNQIKTLDVSPPALAANETPLIVDRDLNPLSKSLGGTYSLFLSANGHWCGMQINNTLVLVHNSKVANVFKQEGVIHFRAISNDGRRLLAADNAFGYLIDVETRKVIKKSTHLLRSIPEPTYDGKHFVVIDHISGMNSTVSWVSVETGEVERHVEIPQSRSRKFDWGFVVPLKTGDVACFTASNTTLFPAATEWAVWQELKTGIKLDWKWLNETMTRGAIHFIHPDGTTERVNLGNRVSHCYIAPDGKHLLARSDNPDGMSYSLFQLPLPSPYPVAMLYGLLAALPVLLLQLIWQRRRRLRTTSAASPPG
jgi:hypothetical protein